MNDLALARAELSGHTLALCRRGKLLFSEKRGIAPMLELLAAGTDLAGYSAADKVVGKAAALLFVKAGIAAVHAVTLSEGGKRILEQFEIPCTYERLTKKIINRQGTGLCPMETAVRELDDPETAYAVLCRAHAALTGKQKEN